MPQNGHLRLAKKGSLSQSLCPKTTGRVSARGARGKKGVEEGGEAVPCLASHGFRRKHNIFLAIVRKYLKKVLRKPCDSENFERKK